MRILTQAIVTGADLDEVRLSTGFDLARRPLREALRKLAGEGHVELTPSRGARVAKMSYTTLSDFFLTPPMI
jgi:DNA-binding GntR family transcriptional regulator